MYVVSGCWLMLHLSDTCQLSCYALFILYQCYVLLWLSRSLPNLPIVAVMNL